MLRNDNVTGMRFKIGSYLNYRASAGPILITFFAICFTIFKLNDTCNSFT